MKKIIKLVLFISSFLPLPAAAQQYNFSEAWVWEYTDDSCTKKEMTIYREPKLNYWLLTQEAFGNTDAMTEWFILKPSGEVWQAYQDAALNSKRKVIRHQLNLDNNYNIPSYWKRGKNTKYYGDATLGFKTIRGSEYKVNYQKTKDKSTFYLAETKANFSALAQFNELNLDAKLPIDFPKDLPENYMVLSEQTTFTGGSVQYHFKYISQTTYDVNVPDDE